MTYKLTLKYKKEEYSYYFVVEMEDLVLDGDGNLVTEKVSTDYYNYDYLTHDFKDGRGSIKAYGKWFMRLSYGSGIGIHGSTNNESSVPGRQSEGCIRLRDEDIDLLKQQYAFVGMMVIIKGEDEGELDFERL